MLSILIPVYKYDVGPLARALVSQLQASELVWELRVYDDASPPESVRWNAGIAELDERIVYRVLSQNLGRAAIRNLLAREALYDNLIFLDVDGGIPDRFITAYTPYLNQNAVINGGRFYGEERSIGADEFLHWYYGTTRESKPAAQRSKLPYHGFQTNNFLAPKSLLLRQPFDENAVGYGHEDTLWGWQLKALRMPLLHIDNAVEHLGLEDSITFLHKQEKAVHNLRLLENLHPDLPSRLSSLANKIVTLKPVLMPLLRLVKPLAKRRLTKTMPGSLYWLDLLKLYWYWK